MAKEIKMESFTKDGHLMENPKKAIVLFYADWCGHCQHFKPTYDEFAKKMASGDLKVMKIDWDKKSREYDTSRLAYKINGFPTIVGFKGNKIAYFDGNRTIKDLTEFVNNL